MKKALLIIVGVGVIGGAGFAYYAYERKPPPPTVTYFESWPADRSLAETKAAIAERQKLKDALMEKQRQSYKALGRAVGMDVEKIEREANALRRQAAQTEATKKAQENAKQLDANPNLTGASQ